VPTKRGAGGTVHPPAAWTRRVSAPSDGGSTDVLAIALLRPRFAKGRRSTQPGVKIELIDSPQNTQARFLE
jgi:hypothetical protein